MAILGAPILAVVISVPILLPFTPTRSDSDYESGAFEVGRRLRKRVKGRDEKIDSLSGESSTENEHFRPEQDTSQHSDSAGHSDADSIKTPDVSEPEA
jgi:hypothetical protein